MLVDRLAPHLIPRWSPIEAGRLLQRRNTRLTGATDSWVRRREALSGRINTIASPANAAPGATRRSVARLSLPACCETCAAAPLQGTIAIGEVPASHPHQHQGSISWYTVYYLNVWSRIGCWPQYCYGPLPPLWGDSTTSGLNPTRDGAFEFHVPQPLGQNGRIGPLEWNRGALRRSVRRGPFTRSETPSRDR